MGVCLISDKFEELRINFDEEKEEEKEKEKENIIKKNFIEGQKVIRINEIEIEKIKRHKLKKIKSHDNKDLNIATNTSIIILGSVKKNKAKSESLSDSKLFITPTLKSKEYDITNYPKDVLELINKIRNDPKSFVNDVEQSISNIQNYDNKLIYNGNIKVILNKGENMFKEAIECLHKTNPMGPLNFNKDIEIEMPTEEEYNKQKDFFKNKILIKKKLINIERYYREAIKDPYTGVLMMIVDDTSINQGEKRNTILNPLLNKIYINCKMYGKKFLAYLTFSK